MVVALEKFVRNLEDTGILSGETIKDFIPPKANPRDAEDLAQQLVKHKKLTQYQAEEVYNGKANSLVLGNYILMEKIGSGGMGQVFKAHHRRMDRFVAIKLLPPEMTSDTAAIARFEREVKAVARISHPNIVAALDADCANGIHFLVMELVDGSDLSVLVKKHGPFSVRHAVSYILQAAKGLEAAHKKGIIHRDIKPANLLLDTEGTVKILDLGLARLSVEADASTQAELTNTGTVMGTVDYMAPEQALNSKAADERADIYSLGCSLHYLMTGKSTYGGDSLMAKLLAHRDQPVPSLRSAIADVPEELEMVFHKMVAKKTQDRYQTVTQLIAELQKCHHNQDQSLAIPAHMNTMPKVDRLSVLIDETILPSTKIVVQQSSRQPPRNSDRNKFVLGGGIFGVLALLAGIIISLRTKDGTLIVEVNQPDAMVQVLDQEGQVEISRKGVNGKVTINVDPGKHRLKVVKDGFTTYGQEFAIENNGQMQITARLEPLQNQPAMSASEADQKDPTKAVPMASAAAVTPSITPLIADAKQPLAFQKPGFDDWVTEVSALPAEQQLEAVSKKLVELNPEFDGKLTHWDGQGSPVIYGGVVIQLAFATDKVTDISPVRALSGLTELHCPGSSLEQGRLSDLSPLQGLSLTHLNCGLSRVNDLSPLQGMPLTSLLIYNSSVSDLSPLRGMKMTSLNCANAGKIADLSPLKGMPLNDIVLQATLVSDLSPLTGMPLQSVNLNNAMFVTDLSPLKGMKLSILSCSWTQVTDLSPLKEMPLTELYTQNSHVADYSILKGMPLKVLGLNFRRGRDTELLRSLASLETINEKPAAEFWKQVEERQAWIKPITTFRDPGFQTWERDVAALTAEEQVKAVSQKLVELNPGFDGKVTPQIDAGVVWSLEFVTDQVNDVSPVRAIKGLKKLSCGGSEPGTGKLSDLSPLQGLLLTNLDCRKTEVGDLSPLQGMPLTSFNLQYTPVTDLAPLRGMPLKYLLCDECDISDISPLKGMSLNGLQLGGNNVADLSPLTGMPITFLNLDYTCVTDLSPLQDMPLTQLKLPYGLVKDLTPLTGMKLTLLHIAGTRVTDLSPLTGMPLTNLYLFDARYQKGTNINDHTPLQGLPLRELTLDFEPQRDSELLRSIKTLDVINDKPVAEFWRDAEKVTVP